MVSLWATGYLFLVSAGLCLFFVWFGLWLPRLTHVTTEGIMLGAGSWMGISVFCSFAIVCCVVGNWDCCVCFSCCACLCAVFVLACGLWFDAVDCVCVSVCESVLVCVFVCDCVVGCVDWVGVSELCEVVEELVLKLCSLKVTPWGWCEATASTPWSSPGWCEATASTQVPYPTGWCITVPKPVRPPLQALYLYELLHQSTVRFVNLSRYVLLYVLCLLCLSMLDLDLCWLNVLLVLLVAVVVIMLIEILGMLLIEFCRFFRKL